MTDTKKTRTMTIRRFISQKLSGKTTAEGFLAAHNAWLRNYTFLNPILEAYQQKKLLPTPTLTAVQSALLTHMLESEAKTAKAKMGQRQAKGKSKGAEVNDSEVPNKAYTITLMVKVGDQIQVGEVVKIIGYKIRTPKGDIIVDTKEQAEGYPLLDTLREVGPAMWDVDDFGAAMKLVDRRLFQREDSDHAIIRNNYGKPIETKVYRGDAIARVLKQGKGPTIKAKGKSTKTLGFTPHAKQTRVTGPWSLR